jgi:hypothetical protein
MRPSVKGWTSEGYFVYPESPLAFAAFAQTGKQPKPITNADVIAMSRTGVPESTILLAIQNTPGKFDV